MEPSLVEACRLGGVEEARVLVALAAVPRVGFVRPSTPTARTATRRRRSRAFR
jgi:protein-L-isoaspartate O-methyltransferase